MSGSRKRSGRPTKTARRAAYWLGEIGAAVTAEEQFGHVVRWFRSETSRLGPADSSRVLHEASAHLAGVAEQISKGRAA
jgi:hypothetical protein